MTYASIGFLSLATAFAVAASFAPEATRLHPAVRVVLTALFLAATIACCYCAILAQ